VAIESIRKMLAGAADMHNALGSTSFWMCKVRWLFGNKIPISLHHLLLPLRFAARGANRL